MEQPAPYAKSQPLVVEDVELAAPHAGEVLVEIVAAGLCHSDLSVINGSRARPMPMVIGHEAAGIVREVGPGVRDLKPDDHVVFSYVPVCGRCLMCAGGRGSLCENGAKANGAGTLITGDRHFKNKKGQELNHHLGVSAFSQFTVAAEESLIKIDPKLPLEKAALFGCAVMTGVGAIVNTAKVEAGASVAVFGLGGVGLSSILGARATGSVAIVAVDVIDSKLELAKQLGATHTVNAKAPDAVDQIRQITNGGAGYTFDCSGIPAVLSQAYAATKRGGTTVAIGLPHPSQTMSLSPLSMVAEERTLKGSYMGSCVPRRDVPRFIAMYQAGLLPVDQLHTHTIALDDVNDAMDKLAAGQAVRQVISFH